MQRLWYMHDPMLPLPLLLLCTWLLLDGGATCCCTRTARMVVRLRDQRDGQQQMS
jgi:hypothetical protein